MRALTYLGIVLFYFHYYFLLALFSFCNVFKYLFKLLTQKSTEKQSISPYEVVHKDVFTNRHQIVSHEGYALQTFTFQTEDKVHLEMWRVYSKDTPPTKPYPILLMHGLLDCSVSWFLQVDKSKSLPYMLAAQGYEVWLGNNRGNTVTLKQENQDEQYWDYNLDHLVQFDQPAIINGVLENSKKNKLIYVAHSQGSAQFIFSLGIHSHLTDKIAGFIGLGTIISFTNLKGHAVLQLLDRFKLIELCRFMGFKKILVLPRRLTRAVGVLIYNSRFYHNFMMMFVRLLCGFSNKNKISQSLFGVMIAHEPGGSSSNNALHWVQCYRNNGIMKRFDHGKKKNLQLYGSQVPTTYCLEHLKSLPFKTYLFRGLKDAVMTSQNFEELANRFPAQKVETHELDDYHHLDYIWSETAHIDLFPHIISIAEDCSKE